MQATPITSQQYSNDNDKTISDINRDTKENTLNLEDIRSSPEEVERIYLLCKSLRSLSSVELWPSAELHN